MGLVLTITGKLVYNTPGVLQENNDFWQNNAAYPISLARIATAVTAEKK